MIEADGRPHVWPVAADGTLVNRAAAAILQPEYEPCIRFVCAELRRALGDGLASVYLRGSVAVGAGVPPYSDLDLVVVTRGDHPGEFEALRALALERFPFVQDVDIALCPVADLGVTWFGTIALSYLLVEARRIAGEDLVASFEPLRPDAAFARMRFPGLGDEMTWLWRMLEGRAPPGRYRGVERPLEFWAKWSMRSALRSTQMVAMLDTGLYSNHLGTCRALASEHFRREASWIDRAAANERLARSDPAEAADILALWHERTQPLWERRIAGPAGA